MKTVYYMHIPLWVDVFRMAQDLPMPRSVYFDHKEYKVTRIISSGEALSEHRGRRLSLIPKTKRCGKSRCMIYC